MGNLKLVDKLDFFRIKNFCVSKDTTKKVKRQLTEWKKVSANHIYKKRHVFRKHKEFFQINNKMMNNPIKE